MRTSTSNGLAESRRPREPKFLHLVVLDHARDADDPDIFHVLISPHAVADFPPVDIREHDVEDNQVWAVLLHHHARIEAVGGNPDLKAAIFLKGLIYSRDEIRLIVDKQDFSLSAFQSIRRDAVVLHELVQRSRDAPELRAGHRKPLSCPLSKQRIMVCCETLQIFAASPVVNTVFIRSPPCRLSRLAKEVRARR